MILKYFSVHTPASKKILVIYTHAHACIYTHTHINTYFSKQVEYGKLSHGA